MRIHKQPWVRGRRTPKTVALRLQRGGWRGLTRADLQYLAQREVADKVVRYLDYDLARAVAALLGIPAPARTEIAPCGLSGLIEKAARVRRRGD